MPESRLVLYSVGKHDIALPRFNVLQPLIVLVIISPTRIHKLARIIGRCEDGWRNIPITFIDTGGVILSAIAPISRGG